MECKTNTFDEEQKDFITFPQKCMTSALCTSIRARTDEYTIPCNSPCCYYSK